MLYSMTGCANQSILITIDGNDIDGDDLTKEPVSFVCNMEIQSVNHRFADIGVKINDPYRNYEHHVRSIIAKQITRGKIAFRLTIQKQNIEKEQEKVNLLINHDNVRAYIKAFYEIKDQYLGAIDDKITFLDLLKCYGVINTSQYNNEKLNDCMAPNYESKMMLELSKALDQLIIELKKMQRQEGKFLEISIRDILNNMQNLILQIKEQLPKDLSSYQDKLKNKIIATLIEAINCSKSLDFSSGNCLSSQLTQKLNMHDVEQVELRLQHEYAHFIQKFDIEEEVLRLSSHINEFFILLDDDKMEAVGKKLDFLLQEMNREANTLGNKAISLTISSYARQIKILIEQIREQVQNII